MGGCVSDIDKPAAPPKNVRTRTEASVGVVHTDTPVGAICRCGIISNLSEWNNKEYNYVKLISIIVI